MLPIYQSLIWKSKFVEGVKVETRSCKVKVLAFRETHPIMPGFRLIREKLETSIPLHYLPVKDYEHISVCFRFTKTDVNNEKLAYKELYHKDFNVTNGYQFDEQTLRVINVPLYRIKLEFDEFFIHNLIDKPDIPEWFKKLIDDTGSHFLIRIQTPPSLRELAMQACLLPETSNLSDVLNLQSKALLWLSGILELTQRNKLEFDYPTENFFEGENRAKNFVAKACEIIHKDYSQSLTIKALANRVGTNEFYLKKFFKCYKKTSIHEYLIQYRLTKAKKILINYPELKVLTVAELCGYDAAYFSYLFKKNYGITPSRYRIKILRKEEGKTNQDL